MISCFTMLTKQSFEVVSEGVVVLCCIVSASGMGSELLQDSSSGTFKQFWVSQVGDAEVLTNG